MVQQLSLTSSFGPNNFHTVRVTLEALTGLRPQPLARHTVILRPKFPYTPEQTQGKSQVESYRMRMVRAETRLVDCDASKESIALPAASSISSASRDDSIWTLQLSDIPAGGTGPVSVQNIYETTIYKTDDVLGYMDEFGYMPETEYWEKGCRFYHNDVIIEVLRLYVRNKSDSSEGDFTISPLGGSARWQVRCFVNVSRLNDLDSVASGVKQLEALRKDLTGLLELKVPDRTAMDSRVNSRIARVN